MNRTNQPTELHMICNVLHALKGFIGGRAVVQQQQDSRAELHQEGKKRDAPEQVPVAVFMDGYGFLAKRSEGFCEVKALVDPGLHSDYGVHVYAACFRLT